MSESSSLYARVQLTESALHAFLESKPALPRQYHDWREWLSSKQYYGEISDASIQAMEHIEGTTVGNTLALWLQKPYEGLGQASYDAATQRWILGLLDCLENYKDFILVLSLLRAISHYKDLPGDDFILIYPYMGGGTPEAYVPKVYVIVSQGRTLLASEVPDAVREEADAGLSRIREALASSFSKDDL